MVALNTMRLRWFWGAGCTVAVCCCAPVWVGPVWAARAPSSSTAAARSSKAAQATLTPWELSERGRETLEAIPEESRTKADYAAAMDGFRAIYHERPGDVHAPSAVYAVAELLEEQGRTLHDARTLKAAIGQYEFLRTQYPGSSLRVMALLEEAQIEANDLGDVAAAKERYALFLKQYPSSGHAEEARAGLDALTSSGSSRDQVRAVGTQRSSPAKAKSGMSASAPASVATSEPPAGASSLGATPVTRGTVAAPVTNAAITANDVAADRQGISMPVDAELDGMTTAAAIPANVAKTATERRKGGLAQVSGIRHWSTPTYTRVAIDLGDNVTYEAARVPNPDRIYFDLHGTRLAQELVGKSFAVTDDGFLKKIRAAQFSNDMTRVVLDVNDVTEYSAFLLPNPYRLIIDIHGGKDQGSGVRNQESASTSAGASSPSPASPTPASVPTPVAAPVVKATVAKPVPNTVSTKTSSVTEIAALSAEPGKVEATTVPTSRPIAEKVTEQSKAPEVGGTEDSAATGVIASSSTAAAISTKRIRKGKTADVNATPARAAAPTADGQTSLVRALGLKVGRIVIDAGHGGHDSGTIGVDGIEEKDVVLDVALRVGTLLHERLGAEIIYTRSDDTFIPLETRTAIANKAQADLFLSIHANSSPDATARGVETYYLNFTSSPDALETAARENAVSDQSIHQLSDLVKKIALREKIDESREFASDVEASLYGGLQRGNTGLKDRGVKKAPFVVLIGANMPSILAEISFVTNPKDANQLSQPEYRQRVAESLYRGVAKYAGGLSATKSATERASTK
jgi:N-acetylmuramoyl-L-alanine amidase